MPFVEDVSLLGRQQVPTGSRYATGERDLIRHVPSLRGQPAQRLEQCRVVPLFCSGVLCSSRAFFSGVFRAPPSKPGDFREPRCASSSASSSARSSTSSRVEPVRKLAAARPDPCPPRRRSGAASVSASLARRSFSAAFSVSFSASDLSAVGDLLQLLLDLFARGPSLRCSLRAAAYVILIDTSSALRLLPPHRRRSGASRAPGPRSGLRARWRLQPPCSRLSGSCPRPGSVPSARLSGLPAASPCGVALVCRPSARRWRLRPARIGGGSIAFISAICSGV